MRHADILAALRKPGRFDEQYRECLEALASTLHSTDPICVILDHAIAELEAYEDGQRAVAEMTAADLDKRRYPNNGRGEYDAATPRVHRFVMEAL